MNSKYRMFKNYMYNDLGITKEDIREWTKEAVKEVAQNYLEHHVDEWDIKSWVRNSIDNVILKISPSLIWESISKKYNISINKVESEVKPNE